jgi:GAF domain-containing protein
MENARLITETREALEQQTATAEVLQVINSSPGNLAPVFDTMLEKATHLCEAPYGIFRTWDGERFHFVAAHGDTIFKNWAGHRTPFTPEFGPLGRLVRGEVIVPVVDALAEPAYQISAGFRESIDASALRSGIAVGLRKEGTLLGSLAVYRQEMRPFTDKQIALLQNFAAQAVIAMENARLITETQEALEQQTATAEVLQVINSSPGYLQPVFDSLLEKAMQLCGAAYGVLAVTEGEQTRTAAARWVADSTCRVAAGPSCDQPDQYAARSRHRWRSLCPHARSEGRRVIPLRRTVARR